MRITIFICLFVVLFDYSSAQTVSTNVIITNLQNRKGNLYLGWYDDARNFTKSTHAVFEKIVATEGKEEAVILFENIPVGTYAIAVFFDENGNGVMDKNIVGIPKEKYGFSNNILPLFRAATFKEASFFVGDDKPEIITINLK